MAKDALYDLFERKQASAASSTVDWRARREEWIQSIEAFYTNTIVGDYLVGLPKGLVTASFRPKELTEDRLGTYSVREMILKVGDEEVVLSPKGRNIVGSQGRIDLIGERGEATLVLFPHGRYGRWSIVVSRRPTLNVVPLTKDLFVNALREIMRK